MALAEAVAAPAAPAPSAPPGFWERLIAYVIDYQAIALIVQLITLPTTISQFAQFTRTTGQLPRGTAPTALPFAPPGTPGANSGLVVLLLFVYFVYFWSGAGGGRTWGMRVMGLRLEREDGTKLTLTQSLIRAVGLIISLAAVFIGVIWVAFDPKKQGWHDKMAGSLVTYAEPVMFPDHPVAVSIGPPVSPQRFWAVPVIGIVVKGIALIPVFVMVVFAAIFAVAVVLVAWIPVLIMGRYPAWAFVFVRGLMRWSLRINAFVYGLSERYPWPGRGSDDPARLEIAPPGSSSRLWAIPVLGFLVKAIFLIPASVVLSFAGQALGFAFVILWAPVLFTGSYPAWGYRYVQANLRWGARIEAFFLGLSEEYPDPWNWER